MWLSNITHINLCHNVLYKHTGLVILAVICKIFHFKTEMINFPQKGIKCEKK